ncbi:MAG TPA: response regulator [Anaeromyxobacteraceae bacterium]|nr:response regulator [Anaeromyxobacteraceae bacterium]
MDRACILVVEDEADLRDSLAEALGDSGVDVAVAADGLDALERLRAGLAPSVILADLNMPRLGGEAFVAAIREEPRWSGIPVITMTGGTDEPRAKVSAHLEKPFDVGDLLAIIVSLCETRPVSAA